MAQDLGGLGSALGGELAGLLDFLNRIPREALSTDEEAARKHYVELCKDMHKRKLARPPELPPRPLGGQLEAGMRTKSVPDCRVDAGMELDPSVRAGSRLSQHSLLHDIASGDESPGVQAINESASEVSVYWSGHLNHGSKKEGSIRMSWNRRWCVIRDDRLYCYKTANDQLSINEYSLYGCQVALTADGEVEKAHSFKVIQYGRRDSDAIYFAVFVAEDMTSCLQAFTVASTVRGATAVEFQQPRAKSTSFSMLMSDETYQRPRPFLTKPVMRPLNQRGRTSGASSTPLSLTSGPLSATSGPLSVTSDTSGHQGLDEGTDAYEALDEAEPESSDQERIRIEVDVIDTVKQPKRKIVKTRQMVPEHESVYEELDFPIGSEEDLADDHGSPEEYSGTTASSTDASSTSFVRETRKSGIRGSGRRLKELIYGKIRTSKRSTSDLKHRATERSAFDLIDDSTMSGYLMKKDSAGHTWRRRWCVVRETCFYYFRSEEQAKPQLAVVLRGWTIKSYDADAKRPHAFQISHQGILPYCFAADSPEIKEEWWRAISSAINLESLDNISAPMTPAKNNEGNSRSRHLSSGNELDGEALLKAVQSLGASSATSPVDQPPPLPNRGSMATNGSTTDSLYDQLGPPRPLPTAVEPRTLSPRVSLSSMAMEKELYNVPPKKNIKLNVVEGIYNVPRPSSVDKQNPMPKAAHAGGSDDEEDHYEPLDLQPLPPRLNLSEDGETEKENSRIAQEASLQNKPVDDHVSTETDKADGELADADDEDDGFPKRSATLPSKFGRYVASGTATLPKRLPTEKPLRPSSIASGVVEIDGYLFKRSRRLRRWVQRYCKVRSKKFFYYRNKDDPPVDEFRLLGHELNIPPQPDVKRPYAFQLMSRGHGLRNLIFAVDNKQEFDQWRDVLLNACSIQVRQVNDISQIHVEGGGPGETQPLAVAKERCGIDGSEPCLWKVASEGHMPSSGDSPPVKRSMSAEASRGLKIVDDEWTRSKEALDLAVERAGTPKKRGWLYNSLRRYRKKRRRMPLIDSFKEDVNREMPLQEDDTNGVNFLHPDNTNATAEKGSTRSIDSKEMKMPTPVSTFKPTLKQSHSDVVESVANRGTKKEVHRTHTDPDTRSGGVLRRLSDKWRSPSRKKKHPDAQSTVSSMRPLLNNLLHVQNNKGLSRTSAWTQYWCVLQDAYIYCYRRSAGADPRPVLGVPLISGHVERCSTDEDVQKGNYLFRVIPKEEAGTNGDVKPVVFRACAEQELEKWVGTIRDHIKEVTEANALSSLDDNIRQESETSGRSRANSHNDMRVDQFESGDHPPDPPERPFSHQTLSAMSSLAPPDDDVYFHENDVFSLKHYSSTKSKKSIASVVGKSAVDSSEPTLPYYIDTAKVTGPLLSPLLACATGDSQEGQQQEPSYLHVEDANEISEQVVNDETKSLDRDMENKNIREKSGLLRLEAVADNSEPFQHAAFPTPLSSPEESGEVDCEGWLSKKTMMNSWSERYCRLTDGILYHYKNETETKPILSMSVSGCRVRFVQEERGRHIFRVAAVHRSGGQLLATAESEDMTRWVNALKRAAANQPNVVKKSQESNGRAVGASKPRRSHTFHTNETSDKLVLERSCSNGEGRNLEDRHKSNEIQAPRTSSSEGDFIAGISSYAELRKSFGKGKKKWKTSDMIDKTNISALGMQDASQKGILHQKVGVTAWVRRWCALKDRCLYVYRSANDKQPVDSILLPGWEIHLTNRSARKKVIKIWHPQMKSLYFFADRVSHNGWLSSLQEATMMSGEDGSNLTVSRGKTLTASSTSVSSGATASSFETDTSSGDREPIPDPEFCENGTQGRYEEEVEAVKVKHAALNLQLSTRHSELERELADLKQEIDDLQQIVNASTTGKGDSERKLRYLSLKYQQNDRERRDVEQEISFNKADELRALGELEEQQIRDLKESGITVNDTQQLSSDEKVDSSTQDLLSSVTPPVRRRVSLEELNSQKVQHEL